MDEYLVEDNCQKINPINIDIYESHIYKQLKTHDIAGRMFENKYDLALAIMDGMEACSVKGGYILEHLSLIPPEYLLLLLPSSYHSKHFWQQNPFFSFFPDFYNQTDVTQNVEITPQKL